LNKLASPELIWGNKIHRWVCKQAYRLVAEV